MHEDDVTRKTIPLHAVGHSKTERAPSAPSPDHDPLDVPGAPWLTQFLRRQEARDITLCDTIDAIRGLCEKLTLDTSLRNGEQRTFQERIDLQMREHDARLRLGGL